MSQSDTFSSEDFDYIKNKIFALAGIHYTEKKWDLVESRVQSLFRKSEIKSMSDLKNQLEAKNSKTLQTFINLLTTNKTDFFREPRHFDYLIRELIPIWTREEKKEVNVWSCASSTGEEPYTVAMILKKHLPENIRWNVFASDIDTDVLQFAKNGVYLNQNLKEIPEQYHDLLIQGKGQASNWFKISDSVHCNVHFKKHNLVDEADVFENKFDLILCRNVLIYFERETISKLMSKLHKSLAHKGCLFIGHSESIQNEKKIFESLQVSVFSKK